MIVGQRIRLRRIGPEDVEHLLRWQAAPAVMRSWADTAPRPSRERIERDVDGRLAGDETSLSLIIETLDGTPVGRLDIEEIDPRHRSAQLMHDIAEPDDAGQGLGRDAIAIICSYLFDQRGLHRVSLTVIADDDRTVHVCEQLGFHRDGVLRDHIRVNGALRDQIVVSLLAGELRT